MCWLKKVLRTMYSMHASVVLRTVMQFICASFFLNSSFFLKNHLKIFRHLHCTITFSFQKPNPYIIPLWYKTVSNRDLKSLSVVSSVIIAQASLRSNPKFYLYHCLSLNIHIEGDKGYVVPARTPYLLWNFYILLRAMLIRQSCAVVERRR